MERSRAWLPSSIGFYLMYALGGLWLVALGIAFDSIAAAVVGVGLTLMLLLGAARSGKHSRWNWFA